MKRCAKRGSFDPQKRSLLVSLDETEDFEGPQSAGPAGLCQSKQTGKQAGQVRSREGVEDRGEVGKEGRTGVKMKRHAQKQ